MLVFEKCLQPKKPRYDDSGEGCGAVRMQCFEALISAFFLMAYEPQSMKTTFSAFSEMVLITASVNSSQPLPWCEPACDALTVSVALSSNTPCSAQRVRLPVFGAGMPKSEVISLKMF